MALARRDDWLTDAQGRSLAGAQVYYCAPQPATTSSVPPSPLAAIFSNITGTATSNPQITDGFGHAVAYADDSILYTIVYVHPLFGPNPVVLMDQSFGGGGGGGGGNTFVQASTTEGTITGSIPGSVFTLPSVPLSGSLVLNANGQILNPGTVLGPTVGYTISGAVVTLYTALTTEDVLNANYAL
jgi:hypothetical protein